MQFPVAGMDFPTAVKFVLTTSIAFCHALPNNNIAQWPLQMSRSASRLPMTITVTVPDESGTGTRVIHQRLLNSSPLEEGIQLGKPDEKTIAEEKNEDMSPDSLLKLKLTESSLMPGLKTELGSSSMTMEQPGMLNMGNPFLETEIQNMAKRYQQQLMAGIQRQLESYKAQTPPFVMPNPAIINETPDWPIQNWITGLPGSFDGDVEPIMGLESPEGIPKKGSMKIRRNEAFNADLNISPEADLKTPQSLNLHLSQIQNTDLSQFQNTDLSQFQNTDLSHFQNTDLSQFQNTDLSQFQNTDLNQFQNSNLNQFQLQNPTLNNPMMQSMTSRQSNFDGLLLNEGLTQHNWQLGNMHRIPTHPEKTIQQNLQPSFNFGGYRGYPNVPWFQIPFDRPWGNNIMPHFLGLMNRPQPRQTTPFARQRLPQYFRGLNSFDNFYRLPNPFAAIPFSNSFLPKTKNKPKGKFDTDISTTTKSHLKSEENLNTLLVHPAVINLFNSEKEFKSKDMRNLDQMVNKLLVPKRQANQNACVDYHENCSYWAANNQCQREHRGFMKNNCAKSCRVC